ncbi:unnamed protein product [Pedinophyceae sp. YPF-701]|nr:unnamed protein product [Pedinophyceae sp. YPF-701]
MIGSGSVGTTYRCVSPEGDPVAIKVVTLRTGRWKAMELFEREARVLRNLSHPNIPQYRDSFEVESADDVSCYLVQDLVLGKTLTELVQEGWRPRQEEVGRIARELLGVLAYLGSLQPPVVHRDIKPDNIVIQGGVAGGVPFLVDFGGVQDALKTAGDQLGTTVVGTFGFMAPEQFRGEYKTTSDLYALGATLLYLASGGRSPETFPTERMRVKFEQEIETSPRLQTLLGGLLEPHAEDRFTVAQALDVLDGRGAAGRSGAVFVSREHEAVFRMWGINADAMRMMDVETAVRAMEAVLPREEAEEAGRLLRDADLPPDLVYETVQMVLLAPERGLLNVSEQVRLNPKRTVRPKRARSKVSVEGGRLIVEIPPQGFVAAIPEGAFALGWNGIITYTLFEAVVAGTGGLSLLGTAGFLGVFYLAGVPVIKTAVDRAFLSERLVVGRHRWRLSQELQLGSSDGGRKAPSRRRLFGGDRADLLSVKLRKGLKMQGSQDPDGMDEPVGWLELRDRGPLATVTVGGGPNNAALRLAMEELRWLEYEINKFLQRDPEELDYLYPDDDDLEVPGGELDTTLTGKITKLLLGSRDDA